MTQPTKYPHAHTALQEIVVGADGAWHALAMTVYEAIERDSGHGRDAARQFLAEAVQNCHSYDDLLAFAERTVQVTK